MNWVNKNIFVPQTTQNYSRLFHANRPSKTIIKDNLFDFSIRMMGWKWFFDQLIFLSYRASTQKVMSAGYSSDGGSVKLQNRSPGGIMGPRFHTVLLLSLYTLPYGW